MKRKEEVILEDKVIQQELEKSKKEGKNTKKSNKKNKKQKSKKVRKNKLNALIIIIAILFVIGGVLGILFGTGVLSFPLAKKGPTLYLLSEKVSVGDYVLYDAGNWESDKENPTRDVPFTFGGYQKDVSRNDGVACNDSDPENKGWRVFSVNEGSITLIQAGISMCYYHGYGNATNDKSVSILRNEDETVKHDEFLNPKYAEKVQILSKEDIDKFIGEDTSFKRLDNNLLKVGAPYWLASKYGSYYMWYATEGATIAVDHVGSYGVRVLVTLKKNVKTEGQNNENAWKLNIE